MLLRCCDISGGHVQVLLGEVQSLAILAGGSQNVQGGRSEAGGK